jgi:signal transduction histidine kinase
MGQTAAAIAHEVKNALNGLSMGVDMLAAGRADAATAATVHRRARAEIGRLREVADDLTLFAATPRLARADLDLVDQCRLAAEAVAELADDCGVTVRLDLPERLPARLDGPKVVGALVNLARNGIEAMGPGAFGEALGEAARPGERLLEITARPEAGGAVIEVADRGAGLAAVVRAHLFEPFVTTRRGGTGLGLVIVRRVVEAHGGRVTAADRPGGGTIFRVELPGEGAA